MVSPNEIPIRAAAGPLDATVRVPGSKSLTNRALPIAAMAHGDSVLDGVLFSDDTRVMLAGLESLGIRCMVDEPSRRVRVVGSGGHVPISEAAIDCGLSGTTLRFLAAILATQAGDFRFDGVPRLRERPVGELANAIRTLGGLVTFEQNEGFPPFSLGGRGLRSGEVIFENAPSSQLISGLLMASPMARGDVFIRLRGEIVSRPYLAMTLAVMDAFGVSVVADPPASPSNPHGPGRFIVPAPQNYRATNFTIEPDASSASYFLAAAAVCGGRVTVDGLGSKSVQGDAAFAHVLAKMGCRVEQSAEATTVSRDPSQPLVGIDVDLNSMPDMAQTLAAVALCAQGPTTIRNVANLAVKETDRLSAVAAEARKFGAVVDPSDDGWTIAPPPKRTAAMIATWGDHRMAMAFAIPALVTPGCVIQEPQVVNKTFPGFFDTLTEATATAADAP